MSSIRQKGAGYEVRIKRSGVKEMSKTFPTKAAARAWANEIEAKIDKGENVSRKASSVLFSEACADFLAHYLPEGEMSEREKQLVSAVNEDLDGFAVSKITHDVLKNYVAKMLKREVAPQAGKKKPHPYYKGGRTRTYAASTVRHHYFQIKKILQWHAVREKYVLDPHLFEIQCLPGAWDGQRERRLEKGEYEALCEAARTAKSNREEWILLMRFALATAARAQEILYAKWGDISFERESWIIPQENVKTKTARTVPLHREVVEILRELEKRKSNSSELIFHFWKTKSLVSKGWRRLVVRAGIEDLTFHDLRHEATSRLFESTPLSDAEIMSITGHTNISTLRGYMGLRPNHLAKKIDSARGS